MEKINTSEKAAPIGLDSYLEALPLADFIDGKMMEDIPHAFYFWLSKYHPEVGIVDGVSLEDLYLKNVIEVGMKETDFFKYCYNHHLPFPSALTDPVSSTYDVDFRLYLQDWAIYKNEQYEQWANEHGIITAPGSVMRFTDGEGHEYRVCTDTENRGQIIA